MPLPFVTTPHCEYVYVLGGVQAYAHATVGWAPAVSGQGAGTGGANGVETEQNDDFSKKKRQHTAKDTLPSQPSLAQQQYQPHHHLQHQQRNNLRNAYVGSSSRMKRRKMVVDCKALRAKANTITFYSSE